MHIKSYLATLELVNHERVALGLAPIERLPQGQPRDPMDCAIARAVPGSVVDGIHIKPPSSALQRRLPPEVRKFVAAFDRGARRGAAALDPALLVEGGIDDDKGCLVSV